MNMRSLKDLKQEFINNNNFKTLMSELDSEVYTEGDVELFELSELSIPESNLLALPHDLSGNSRTIKKPLLGNLTKVKEISVWDAPTVSLYKKERPSDVSFILYRDWERGHIRLYIG